MTLEANNRPLPKRPYAHVLGEMGERFVIAHLPSEWITRQISYDYGLDLNVEKVENGRVTGKNFSVQVKALSKRPQRGSHVPVRLSTATLKLHEGASGACPAGRLRRRRQGSILAVGG